MSPSAPSLALHGGPQTVTEPRLKRHRWGQEELARLTAMVDQDSLFYVNGPQCEGLKTEFRKHYPFQWIMPTSSGSAAIHVAVAALQLPPGAEIITSPVTDMGSIIGILYQQHVPVFADINPHTYNLDPEDIRRRITPKTKAIMVVHLTGNPCDMDAIMTIAREHNLLVIEDCAQAWGALYRGKPVGSFGHIACYSFNEFKHVSCGDGGLVATNDERFGPTLSKWGDKFYDRRPGVDARNPTTLAPNYRMSEPQAAVAAGQLEKLPKIIETHVNLGSRLVSKLQALNLPGLSLPALDSQNKHSFWFIILRMDPAHFTCTRDEFAQALAAEGALASAGYIPRPVYRYPLFQEQNFFAGHWPLREAGLTSIDYRQVSCPVAEAVLGDCITFTINPSLTERFIEQTADAIAKVASFYAK